MEVLQSLVAAFACYCFGGAWPTFWLRARRLVPVQRLVVSTAQVGKSAAGLSCCWMVALAGDCIDNSVNTLSVAQAAWKGVDLVGMNAAKVIGSPWSECSGHRAVAAATACTRCRAVVARPGACRA